MKRKYILMSMIAAVTLASCSKDESDNKIDNNKSVVEAEKTIENGVKENVENTVKTIECPVTITVNRDNSISKLAAALDGKSAVFSENEEMRVYLASDNSLLGTLTLSNGQGTKEGTFSGGIQVEVTETPQDLSVYVEVGVKDVNGIVGAYTDLDGAVSGAACLKSGQTTLVASTKQENGYASYEANDVALTDQTSYIVFAYTENTTTSIRISDNDYTVGNNYVLAFVGGIDIVSADLGLNFTSGVGKKYTYNLNAVKSVVINDDINKVFEFTADHNSETFTAKVTPITVSGDITWSSSITEGEKQPIVNATSNANEYTIENKLTSGEYYLTAQVAGQEKGKWLVRVGKKTVTIESLALTYYDGQDWSKLKENADNSQLGVYDVVENYVKFGDKWLKNGDNYVKATDAIQENGTYTLVSNGANSITINNNDNNYTIYYAENETWAQVAARPENAFITLDTESKVLMIGDLYINKPYESGTTTVGLNDVISSNGGYSLGNAVL